MMNAVFWDVIACGLCKKRRIDVSTYHRIERISELGTTLAVTGN
jgi:hypothetical protein